MNLERNSEIKSLESEIKTLREENENLKENLDLNYRMNFEGSIVIRNLESEIKILQDDIRQLEDLRGLKKELEIYKPAYERHIKEIERLNGLFPKCFEAGKMFNKNIRNQSFSEWAKENNITYETSRGTQRSYLDKP